MHRSLCVSLGHQQCLLPWKNSEVVVLGASLLMCKKERDCRIEPSFLESQYR